MTPSYILGLTFIVLVSLIWSAASILVQFLYQNLNFNSPFLLTYIGSSLFVIFIPSRLIWERWIRSQRIHYYESVPDADENASIQQVIIPWQNSASIHRSISDDQEVDETDHSLESPSIQFPSDRTETSDNITRSSKIDVFQICSTTYQEENRRRNILSHVDHIKIASKIAPIWFLSNYFYNLSLAYTSITSSTVLSSMGSVFTFFFALICGDERFTKWKLLGVMMGFTGSFAMSIHDKNNSISQDNKDNNFFAPELWGDAAGLVAAVGYGGYTVLIRVLCPSDENRMSMQLLLGYIGAFNMILFFPFGLWILYHDSCDTSNHVNLRRLEDLVSPSHQCLTFFVLSCVVVKGLIDNVLSDYLWARAIILTSASKFSFVYNLKAYASFSIRLFRTTKKNSHSCNSCSHCWFRIDNTLSTVE